MELSGPEVRVLGCLVEKQLTTPQQYPLTLNALVTACNQASNREPVTAYSDDEVIAALESCKAARLVRFVLPSHGRSVVRYRHVLDEALGLDPSQLAVLCVLMLRGPQTIGELRIRTERMADLGSLGAVEHELELLAGRELPLVERLGRRPGQKEERWADLLRAERPSDLADTGRGGPPATGPSRDAAAAVERLEAELADLRAHVADLGAQVTALRATVADLRDSLGA